MLLALLIVSVILSASLPIISQRTKLHSINYSKYSAVPIGMIAIWGSTKPLPDNTWLECNGQAVPTGIEYEEIRRIYGANLPDYRGVFLRGYGTITHTQNNGSRIGNTATTHSSGTIGAVQGDSIRELSGQVSGATNYTGMFWNETGVFAGFNNTNYYVEVNQLGGFIYHTAFSFAASRVTPVSNEIRPINKAVRYIIKVKR